MTKFADRFTQMISGDMPDAEICAHLLAWEDAGVTPQHLTTAANLLRERMVPVTAPESAIDIVGTGGDGLKTYNISTAVLFVVAGAGVPVAKHGNRAVSSRSGASDVLRELGVRLDISPTQTENCIAQAGVGFLFAPNHHPAMGAVAKARANLGVRTIFNRLGPLCNPASVRHYLLGVYDDDLRELYAHTVSGLGVKRALVVHGGDGMDEITTTTATQISEVNGDTITEHTISPRDFGMRIATLTDLEGGDAVHNAKALRAVLDGTGGAYRDIVLLNAGAALYAAAQADTIGTGIEMAQTSISSGRAHAALEKLVEVSNG